MGTVTLMGSTPITIQSGPRRLNGQRRADRVQGVLRGNILWTLQVAMEFQSN